MSFPVINGSQDTGWEASLSLQLARLDGRTRVASRRHRGPLLVQRAFHPELPASDCCHLYLVHPPGGIVAGDRLELSVHAAPGSQVLITTPAATKFYRSAQGPLASQLQQLTLDDATLEWLPQENIFFPDAQVRVTTRVRLSQASRFLGWEIGCFGLPANERGLGGGRVTQSLELWLQDRPLLIERLRVDGCEAGLAGRWGLAGNAACGTMLAYPANAQILAVARDYLVQQDQQHGAVTLMENLLVCRALAPRASQVRSLFTALWCALRPRLLQRAAQPPRIWAT